MVRVIIALTLICLASSCKTSDERVEEALANIKRGREERKIQTDLANAEWLLEKERAQRERKQSYLNSHPETKQEVRDLINQGMIKPGMTRSEVVAAIGYPTRSNIFDGSREQLVYEISGSTFYAYFTNDLLETWDHLGVR